MIFGKSINDKSIKRLLAQLEDKISELQDREASCKYNEAIMIKFNEICERRTKFVDLSNSYGLYPNNTIQELALKYLEILDKRTPEENDKRRSE